MKNQSQSNLKPRSLLDEFRTLRALLFDTDKTMREILFYSSQAQYISYYEGLLRELVESEKKQVVYLSSDETDPIFRGEDPGVIPRYSRALLPLIFPMIDSSVVVTTIPDLHQYKIKRSFSGVNYLYVFHSLVSTHMMYRPGAFDHFDTLFCAGPHHAKEIRKLEVLHGLPKKTLHEVGYYRLEKIHKQHREYVSEKAKQDAGEKTVLVAPGWHDSNILNTCAEELLQSLIKEGFFVVLRPHPMTIKNSPSTLERIQAKFSNAANFSLDTETTSEKYFHRADVMVSDWSGAALEYAFGTERPVLFVDLPRKVYNPEYEKLGIQPLEIRIRDHIGARMAPEQVARAGSTALDFIKNEREYRDQIIEARNTSVYNFGRSSIIGREIISNILTRGIQGRMSGPAG